MGGFSEYDAGVSYRNRDRGAWRLLCLVVLGGCQLVFAAESSCEPIGHDEDQDGIDDACDACPHVADPDQLAVNDSDAVGDICDPSPDPDQIVLFESFAGPSAQGRWRDQTNQWTIPDDDNLTFNSPMPDIQAVFSGTNQPAPPFTLEYRITIDDINELGDVSVVVDADAAGEGVLCGIIRFSGAEDRAFVEDERRGSGPTSPGELDIQNNAGFTVTMRYEPPSATCVVAPSMGVAATATIALTAPLQPGRLGFKSSDVDAHVAYLVIFK